MPSTPRSPSPWTRLVGLALALALVGSVQAADAPRGVVFGEVRNNLGQTLRDAVLNLEGTDLTIELGGARDYSLELPVGQHVLRARAFGYRVVRRYIQVRADEPVRIDFVLNSLVHSKFVGRVLDGFTGNGTRATYRVLDTPLDPHRTRPDGLFSGYLPRGTYRLAFEAPGFYTQIETLKVPGQVDVRLKPLPRAALIDATSDAWPEDLADLSEQGEDAVERLVRRRRLAQRLAEGAISAHQ